MTLVDWIALASVCAAGAVSPGPSLVVVIKATVSGGRRNGFVTSWAHAIGVGVYAVLVALGLGAAVAAIPAASLVLRIGGVAFLVYLAIKSLRSTGSTLPSDVDARKTGPVDGFLIALLNPKILIWFLALFSQFVSPGSSTVERIGMGLVAVGIDGVWYTIVVAAVSFGPVLQRIQAQSQRIDRIFGILLLLVAVRIAWSL